MSTLMSSISVHVNVHAHVSCQHSANKQVHTKSQQKFKYSANKVPTTCKSRATESASKVQTKYRHSANTVQIKCKCNSNQVHTVSTQCTIVQTSAHVRYMPTTITNLQTCASNGAKWVVKTRNHHRPNEGKRCKKDHLAPLVSRGLFRAIDERVRLITRGRLGRHGGC